MKVQILTTCSLCQGQAYLPVGEAESHNGNKHIRHIITEALLKMSVINTEQTAVTLDE